METTRMDIAIPFPEAAERQLRLRVGACRVRITRGGGSAWVTGTYDDPTGSVPCHINQEGGSATITQGLQVTGLLGLARGVPTFDLALGTAQPYTLAIETGASDTDFEFGGLPLTRLAIKLGAGKSAMRFSEPNPQLMGVLDLDAGAGNMELRGLANANFGDMTLDGGAAAFVFDFSGTLRRDASAYLNTGVSSLTIQVPATTAARIAVESTLGHLETSDGFTTREGGYWTAAAVAGGGPVLTMRVNVALGSLRLQTL